VRILVVDQSSTMRRIIINTLNRLGFRDCHEASSARDALERLADEPVDLIMTDSQMPEMSGVDFIRAIRTTDAIKHVPVLMVSNSAVEDDIVAALRAGANNYIVKPFTPQTIREKIRAVVAV
jgi:two-component system chemotaxis response regulator CheY